MFSSPSLIAKMKGVPSIYYDKSSYVKITSCHGIPVYKYKNELAEWCGLLTDKGLVNNK